MRYQCGACGASQWRGFFPQPTFNMRYAIFHGIALGVCATGTKLLFHLFGYTIIGWRGGLASLAVCAALLLVFYSVAITVEACAVAVRPCRACGRRGLRLK